MAFINRIYITLKPQELVEGDLRSWNGILGQLEVVVVAGSGLSHERELQFTLLYLLAKLRIVGRARDVVHPVPSYDNPSVVVGVLANFSEKSTESR